jgi:NAD-dependent deacetylase
MDDLHDQIAKAAARLADARSILFITGAGISADSGLPTYRGVGGLYDDADTEDGLPIEVCLSGTMLRKQPARTWKYIRQIERACRGAAPNAAHHHIAELERTRERVWVLTQNVDGLHAAAGSKQLIAIHGDVHLLRCTACRWRDRVEDYSGFDHLDDAPRCPSCDAVIRPEVVLFGEMLPGPEIQRLQSELARGFDAVISIGTTAVFPYISAPVIHTSQAGGLTIEINPGTSEVSDLVDFHLRTGAAAAMQALSDSLSEATR